MFRRPGMRSLFMLITGMVVCIVLVALSRSKFTDGVLHKGLIQASQVRDLVWNTNHPQTFAPNHVNIHTAQPGQVSATTPVWQNPVYAERRHLSENMCSIVRGGAVVRLTRYRNVSYCVIPKVGCTFWLNVFRFLHNDTGKISYHSPFSIPRLITHYGPMKTMRFFKTNVTYAPHHLVDDMRFMFVRDPYSRLWSAYVDKFLLVDYWRTEGRVIVKRRPQNANRTMPICSNDITFKEFVHYVISRPRHFLNEHWKPILHLCSPCMYQPHVIGKMETFSQDSRYILRLMNSSWILDSYDHQHHVYQEMDMLIDYNFQIIKTKPYINCTNTTDLSQRLWKTFQINGYIPMETHLSQSSVANINITQFRALAHHAYTNRPAKTQSEWKQQREQAMVDAFKDIPIEMLEKIKIMYKEDFDMFGYDPEPSNIFSGRKKAIDTSSKTS